jgi:hypothetical protein
MEFKKFESVKEIHDYIKDSKYMTDNEHPGICFGFSFNEGINEDDGE